MTHGGFGTNINTDTQTQDAHTHEWADRYTSQKTKNYYEYSDMFVSLTTSHAQQYKYSSPLFVLQYQYDAMAEEERAVIAKLRLVIEDLGLQRDVRVVKTPQVCFACHYVCTSQCGYVRQCVYIRPIREGSGGLGIHFHSMSLTE